jgi:hypothetical protein
MEIDSDIHNQNIKSLGEEAASMQTDSKDSSNIQVVPQTGSFLFFEKKKNYLFFLCSSFSF